MDIYDGRYYRINKKLMVFGGLWPYEENLVKKVFYRLYLGVTIIALSIPQLYGVYKNLGFRADKIIEHTTILMFVCGVFLKLITAIMAENNLEKVYDSVAENWINLKDPREREILADYSENGVLLTIGYLTYMLGAALFYIMVPLIPLLQNFIAPTNQSRLPGYIFRGEFPVDNMRDYYIEIFLFDVICCCSSVYAIVTVDSMYACCVEHCTGLFAICRYRLQLCTNYASEQDRDVAYELIVKIVDLHTKTIAFTDLLEKSYSAGFLLLMGSNIIHCTFVSVILLLKKDENDVLELLRWVGILGGIVTHLFFISWPGQKLIDHSTDLFDDAYNNDWYELSRKSKNLLIFMKMRCLRPCQLTAGGIYIMNMTNFAQIIKTSVSYIAVFASFT